VVEGGGKRIRKKQVNAPGQLKKGGKKKGSSEHARSKGLEGTVGKHRQTHHPQQKGKCWGGKGKDHQLQKSQKGHYYDLRGQGKGAQKSKKKNKDTRENGEGKGVRGSQVAWGSGTCSWYWPM